MYHIQVRILSMFILLQAVSYHILQISYLLQLPELYKIVRFRQNDLEYGQLLKAK